MEQTKLAAVSQRESNTKKLLEHFSFKIMFTFLRTESFCPCFRLPCETS